ncbi:MAG: carboxypeptidase-like regulatory domain-containing protein [Candidatus Thermoplasmatota archaeon]
MWKIALAAVAVLVLSGCSSPPAAADDETGPGDDVEVQVSKTTGALRGAVFDEAVRPIANAQVKLLRTAGALYANTTEAGSFGFSNLEPGTYFIETTKKGYAAVRSNADVIAGDADPPAVRIQLLRDPSQVAYVSAQTASGFILCTTSVVLVCAAPDLVNDLILCGVFGVCPGHLTPDRSGFYLYYEPNATMIQAEMVWDSTQPLSPEITMSMENIEGCEADSDSYVEYATGPSPIYIVANETEIQEGTIGGTCGIWFSFFSGDVSGLPLGVTLQQQIEIYSHEFHGYTPADVGQPDWRLTEHGEPPGPPY